MCSITHSVRTLTSSETLCSEIKTVLDQLESSYNQPISLSAEEITKMVAAILEKQKTKVPPDCHLSSLEFSRKVDVFQDEAIIRLTRHTKKGDPMLGRGGYKSAKLGILVNTKTGIARPVALLVIKSETSSALEAEQKRISMGAELCKNIPDVTVILHKIYQESESPRSSESSELSEHEVTLTPKKNTTQSQSAVKPKITLAEELGIHDLGYKNIASMSNTLKEQIAREMIQIVCVLHSKGIWHRDIKPENFLLMPSKKMKVIDFDFACSTTSSTHAFCGTACFMAPELFVPSFPDVKTDIWALGCSLFKVFTGHHFIEQLLGIEHFEGLREDAQHTAMQEICLKGVFNQQIEELIDKNTSIPQKYRKILKGCLRINCRNRFSTADLTRVLQEEEESETLKLWKALPKIGGYPEDQME